MATSVKITGNDSLGTYLEVTSDTAEDAVKAYWTAYNGITNKPNPTPTPDPPVNG